MSPTVRQTLSYLSETFRSLGIRPCARLGQNFLIDLNLQRVLVDRAELEPADLVIEPGAGTGALTRLLCDQAGWVVAVELDRDLCTLARRNTEGVPNLDLLQADILAAKNRLNPSVVETSLARMRDHDLSTLKLLGNLPYCVATPLIMNVLLSDLPVVSITVTVQQEVADRLHARPATKSYGAVSVLTQALADVDVFRRLPPQVFWPRPKVSSAMVHIVPSEQRRRSLGDLQALRRTLQQLFAHRRQGLLRVLKRQFGKQRPVDWLEALLAELDVEPRRRLEQLPVATIMALVQRLTAAPL